MTMSDWVEKLNAFLKFNGREILHGAGKISQPMRHEKSNRFITDENSVCKDFLHTREYKKLLSEFPTKELVEEKPNFII